MTLGTAGKMPALPVSPACGKTRFCLCFLAGGFWVAPRFSAAIRALCCLRL